MKKAKAPLKKMNKNKSKSKPAPALSRVKQLAKGLMKAMAPKSAAKKPMTKVAPKLAPKVAAPLKPPVKATKSFVKTAPVRPAPTIPIGSKKTAPVKPGSTPHKVVDTKGLKNEKGAKGAPIVAAVLNKPLTKPQKVEKPAKGSKIGKMTPAQHAEYLERMCRENACENQASTKGYCRLDYIKNWKKIKRKEMILKEGKLNQYIEELVSKYPDKYIDVIRQDLSTEVNFNKVIHDLELDESIDDLDYDGDSIDSLIGSVSKSSETGFDDDEF